MKSLFLTGLWLLVVSFGLTPNPVSGSTCSDVFLSTGYQGVGRTVRVRNGTRAITLIAKPSPIERISVVVPVYRELKNDNLERLISNLERQTVDQRRIHVVLVVNHTPEVAKNKASPIYLENRETVQVLNTYRKLR